jgi:uncharacterized protein (TIGR02246 family)
MHIAALFIALLTAGPAPGPQATGPSATDESAVRDVVKTYVDARARGDAGAVRALFTEDADQLTSSGEWRRGREDVVKGSLTSSKTNAGTRTIAVDSIRFPAPGVAIADGAYTIAPAGSGGAARNMRTSFVMVRSGGAWRIAAIRNMLPAAAR